MTPHTFPLHSIVSLRDQPALSAAWPALLCGLWVPPHILQKVRAAFSTLYNFPKLRFHLLCLSTLKRSSWLQLRGTKGASELSQLIPVSTAPIGISTHTDVLASFSLSTEDELSPERITLDLCSMSHSFCHPRSLHPLFILSTSWVYNLNYQLFSFSIQDPISYNIGIVIQVLNKRSCDQNDNTTNFPCLCDLSLIAI